MSRARASLMLLLAASLWGFGNIAHKTVLDHLDPFSVVGLTCLIGAIVILPFLRSEWREPFGKGWLPGLLKLSVLFTIANILQQLAYVGTSVTNASFLISTYTVMTPIFAKFLLGDRCGAVVITASCLTFAGSVLLSGGFSGNTGPSDLIALLSAACFALWTVELGRHAMAHGRPFMTSFGQFLTAAIAILPFSAARGDLALPAILASWPELLILGVFSTAVAYALQTYAQRHTSASHAAIIVSSECVFASAAAALLLGERLSPDGVIGAVLVLMAVVFVATSSSSQPRSSVGATLR